MTREELRDYVEEQRSLGVIPYHVYSTLIDGIDTLEQEPKTKWIPVSERLPKEDGQYLITVKYKHVEGYDDIYAEHGEWTDGRWDMFCFGHCGEVENIIAWMPLPEPYQKGDE